MAVKRSRKAAPGPLTMPELPPPGTAHAWDDPRTRYAWWRYAGRFARRLLVVACVYPVLIVLVAVVAALTSGGLLDLVATLSVFGFIGTVPVLIARLAGFVAALMIRHRLARHPWRPYHCQVIGIEEGPVGAVRLTVRPPEGGTERRVRFQANKRRETFYGPGTHVWIAGDPAVRGVVVLAGGGQMFLFHRDRVWERAQARSARWRARQRTTASTPKKVKPLSPKAQARAAAAAARASARAKSLADNRRQAQQRAAARQARVRAAKDMLPWRKRQGWNG